MITRRATLIAYFTSVARAADERYMSEHELEVVRYMNEARTNPHTFADKRLASETRKNKTALECFTEMKRLEPVGALAPSLTLSRSAQAHAEDMGRSGWTGHYGTDGSDLSKRIHRYGRWTGGAGENCSYGYAEPLDIVLQLIIDAGVAGRGHRYNILNAKFHFVGVGIRPHRWYGVNCVQDFAVEVQRAV